MKKILIILCTVFSLSACAQDTITEGVIIMKQTMHSDDEAAQAQLAMLGDVVSTIYFKNGMSRAEGSNKMSDRTVIIDQSKEEILMLMDIPMVGKVYTKNSTSPTQEQLESITVIEKDETKTILGYECKRYDLVIIDKGVESTIMFYTTEAINVPTQQTVIFGDKLIGMPLYMEISMNQMGVEMLIKFEVTEIKKETIDDSKFVMTIPEGYKKY